MKKVKYNINSVKLDYDDLTDMMYVTLDHYNNETSGTFLPLNLTKLVGRNTPSLKNLSIMLNMEEKKLIGVVILKYSVTKNEFTKEFFHGKELKKHYIDTFFDHFIKRFALEVEKISKSWERRNNESQSGECSKTITENNQSLDLLIKQINEIGERLKLKELTSYR